MNAWWLRIITAGCLAMGAVGCGESESDDGSDSTGSSTATTEDAGSPNSSGNPLDTTGDCISTFAGYSLEELSASAAESGACVAPEDIQEVCVKGPGNAAAAAARGCYQESGGDSDKTAACILVAVDEVTPDLGDACKSCFSEVVVCSINNCALACAADASAPACTSCRIEKGCRPEFFTCAGLIDVDQNPPE